MPALRVAFDATAALQGRTGIARYVEELGAALDDRSSLTIQRFAVGGGPHPPPPATRHLSVPLRVVARSWASGGPPVVERLTGPVDVVHATGLVVPRTRVPVVLTVHDTAPLSSPELHPPRTVRQFRQLLRDLPRVAAVIAISEAVAAEVARHGAAPDRITVVHHGRTELPAPEAVDLPLPFLLAVGEQVPRKDHATLLRAFARAQLAGTSLVLAGRPAEATPALRELAAELGVAEQVRFLGAVGDAQLAWLYENALGLVHPSIEEGFGLPVVEAMAAGLPVVASAIPTTVEVGGDVPLLHPVGDVAGCAELLTSVVADPALRDELGRRGRRRAERFSWAAAAEATEDVYRRALAGAPMR